MKITPVSAIPACPRWTKSRRGTHRDDTSVGGKDSLPPFARWRWRSVSRCGRGRCRPSASRKAATLPPPRARARPPHPQAQPPSMQTCQRPPRRHRQAARSLRPPQPPRTRQAATRARQATRKQQQQQRRPRPQPSKAQPRPIALCPIIDRGTPTPRATRHKICSSNLNPD